MKKLLVIGVIGIITAVVASCSGGNMDSVQKSSGLSMRTRLTDWREEAYI